MHHAPLIAAWLMLGACAETALSGRSTQSIDSDNDATTSSGTEFDTASTEVVMPGWSALSGQLVLVDGIPDASLSTLTTTWYTADTTEALCTATWLLESAFEEPLPNEEPVLTWWTLVSDGADTDCPNAVQAPLVVTLGFGAYDPRLDVSMAARGLSSTPYGVYIDRTDADGVWLTGVAGTDAQLAGAATEDRAPLPDDVYELVPLILSPWEG